MVNDKPSLHSCLSKYLHLTIHYTIGRGEEIEKKKKKKKKKKHT